MYRERYSFTIQHTEPLGRPGWRRTIETVGQSVIIRILNDRNVEVARTWLRRANFEMMLEVIDTARKQEEGKRLLVGQLQRDDGSYFTVSSDHHFDRPAICFRLFSEDGSEIGKARWVTEIDALERVIRQQQEFTARRETDYVTRNAAVAAGK